jgi:hypothetical protein
MQVAYTVCAFACGLLLDVLVIQALLRYGYRRFVFLLLYVVVDFLTSIIEFQPTLAVTIGRSRSAWQFSQVVYYWNERVIQVLVFLIVISMVSDAIGHRKRGLLGLVVLGTVAFAGITFAIHFSSNVPIHKWMIPWTRDLNFGAAILDLGLWAVLVGSREKDYRILMVAGGLGIQFTGGAIGQAMRGLSQTGTTVMGDIMYLTSLMCLYIWWQAFRQPRRQTSKGRPSDVTERPLSQATSK